LALTWVLSLIGPSPADTETLLVVGERRPTMAGRFYPREPEPLEASVRAFLAEALEPARERPLALVVPHAGYTFSGQIAADGYRQAAAHDYDLVVLIGANHTLPGFRGVSVYPGKGYRTPLGLAEIDQAAAEALLAMDDQFVFEPRAHAREHSVEVQVPFVQIVFPGVKILPVVLGGPDAELGTRFGRALAQLLVDRRALLIASSDLSHYPRYEDAIEADLAALAAVADLDGEKFSRLLAQSVRSGKPGLATGACGEAPVLATLEAARALGAKGGQVISYANSGDTLLGDHDRVVGYGAVALFGAATEAGARPRWRPRVAATDPVVEPEDGTALLAFVRRTLERYLTTGTAPLARDLPASLWRQQGVFVTLRQKGRDRGCVGHWEADRPLCQLAGNAALQAAFNDRRFEPLTLDELEAIDIQVSLLTPLQRVKGPRHVVLGRDGVLLRKDGHEAVFLPEVASEQGWTREEMLERLAQKAGLAPNGWRRGAEIHTFQTVVLREPSE
jgi:AmmeMemoRadiSam system protein B/AmmeMemoRadiSam system protein A